MQRSPFPWFWIGLAALLLLLPGPAGRFLLDILGGLTLLLVLLPLIGAGVGVLAWQWMRRRLHTCEACGTVSLASEVCPACGTWLGQDGPGSDAAQDLASLDPSQVIINVEAVDVEPSTDPNKPPPS